MNEQLWLKRLIIFALPVIVVLFYFTASSHFTYTPDDTYIYLQYAKNVVHGNGLSFNAGEPSYGFTSPLWLFIIALGGKMGIDVYVAAKGIDLVIACLSLIVFYFTAFEVMRDVPVAICATAAFSVNAWLMRWAGTGMETSLSVLLVLAVVLFCLRNEYFISIFLAGLLSLVRPEACVIVPLVMGDVYGNSHNKNRALKMIVALGVIYVAMLTPWLVYAWKTFGSVIPNTALSKAGFQFNLNELGATILDTMKTIILPDGIAVVVLIASALYLRSPRRWNSHEKQMNVFFLRQSMVGIVWIMLIPIVYILTDVNVVSRYFLLVTPFITIYAFVFLRRAIDRFSDRAVYSMIFLLTALVMLQNQVVYSRVVRPGIDAFEKGMETCLIPIAQWLKEQTPPDAKIIIGDIGAVGYYSDRELCDAAGLITTKMLPFFRQNLAPYDIIEKKLYQNVCDVDYVVHRSSVFEQLKNDTTLIPLMTRPFSGMSLTEHRIIYYTIYKVKKPS